MSSNIPEARERLNKVATDLEEEGFDQFATDIREIVDGLLHRKPRRKKAMPSRSHYMTKAMRLEIRRYLQRHPSARPSAVAKVFGTDPSRTREVVQAMR